MKRYIFTALALAAMMTCSNISVYAQVPDNQVQETTEKAVSAHYLTYGKIQSITKEGDILQSITAKDVKDNAVVYTINKQTVFLDDGAKTKLDPSTLKAGDSVYFYHTSAAEGEKTVEAEAVAANMPMDAGCAKLHTVEALAINKDGTIVVTSDKGSINLKTDKDVVIKDFATNKPLQISDACIGCRFFTWYDMIQESYPAQAYMKQIVILPKAKATEEMPHKDNTKNQVTYKKEALPKVNDVSFVPLRETADKLGLTVEWDGKKRVTKLESDTRSMNLAEGKDSYVSKTTIKGAVGMTAPLQLGAAPFIDKTNVMYIPAEAFRALVGYDVIIADDTITIAKSNKKS